MGWCISMESGRPNHRRAGRLSIVEYLGCYSFYLHSSMKLIRRETLLVRKFDKLDASRDVKAMMVVF